ncbi:hypothetical protein D3C81_1185100 [compost metagenome]
MARRLQQGRQSRLVFRQLRDGVFHVFLRQQHRLLIARQRALRFGLRAAQACLDAAQTEGRIADRWRHLEGARTAVEHAAAAQRKEAEETAQAQARIQVGRGGAHVFAGGGQQALGAHHVGTLLDQAVHVAERQLARQRRLLPRRGGQRDGAWRLSAQDVEPVLRLAQARLQGRQHRLAARQVGQRVVALFRQAAAGADARVGQCHRSAPAAHLRLRQRQVLLVAQRLVVIARHFGGDRQLHLPQVRLRRVGVRLRRTAHVREAAEQVDLPLRVEAYARAGAGGAAVWRVLPHLALPARLARDGRQFIEPAFVENGARCQQIRLRLGDIEVVFERAGDQLRQTRIVEKRPPGGLADGARAGCE